MAEVHLVEGLELPVDGDVHLAALDGSRGGFYRWILGILIDWIGGAAVHVELARLEHPEGFLVDAVLGESGKLLEVLEILWEHVFVDGVGGFVPGGGGDAAGLDDVDLDVRVVDRTLELEFELGPFEKARVLWGNETCVFVVVGSNVLFEAFKVVCDAECIDVENVWFAIEVGEGVVDIETPG